ncbi:MAG TPA: transglycosylase SLT domain-containing protein [Xanthobacteraceae bacterium]|nr:transglycosylase SLT domain-containing protein [Xanthobacteraceae bacterium]
MPADPISTANAAVAHITGAIRQAARAVGTSFSYLLATAKVESNFNPGAKAATSSAQGLFQFIEQTWLSTLKEAGPRLGYGAYADAIVKSPSGRMEVTNPAMRKEILGLRQDPQANAAMAGAFTNKNASILQSRLGRAPTEGELYIAHFLGAGGAGKLINAAATRNPPAAALFPGAASANRSIFYDKAGRARLASEVYANLTGRYEVARLGTTAMAAKEAPVRVAAAIPDPAGTTQAFAAYQPPSPFRDESGPVFHALFHTSERPEAVAPRINQLWGTPPAAGQARLAAAPTAAAPANGRPLDLFQDLPPDIGGLFRGRG